MTSAFLAPISHQNSLWQICGRNKWKVTGNGCKRLQKPLILLVAAIDSNQLVKFSNPSSFGTVRSEVRILSPRPITYVHQQFTVVSVNVPLSLCRQFADKFFDSPIRLINPAVNCGKYRLCFEWVDQTTKPIERNQTPVSNHTCSIQFK